MAAELVAEQQQQQQPVASADQIRRHRNLIEPAAANDDDQQLGQPGQLGQLGQQLEKEQELDEEDLFQSLDSLVPGANASSRLASLAAPVSVSARKLAPKRRAGDNTGGRGRRVATSAGYETFGEDPEAATKVHTIYFGGFFPWLGEDMRSASQGAASPKASGPSSQQQQQVKMRPANRKRKQQQRQLNKHQPQLQQQQQQQALAAAAGAAYANESAAAGSSPLSASFASPKGADIWDDRHQLGRSILPAVRLALDHINKNKTILPSYRLEIMPRDTQVSSR